MLVLELCARSSVSANLLANEKRVWRFLVSLWNDDVQRCTVINDGTTRTWRCEMRLFTLITYLMTHVNERTWKFVEQYGFLNNLLAGLKEEPHTCNSQQSLFIIFRILTEKSTQESIDTLVSGGLFILLEQLIRKSESSNLLQDAQQPCPKCNYTNRLDCGMDTTISLPKYFLTVKK